MISTDHLIREFVKHYNKLLGLGLAITEWPDKKERNKPACDALAEYNSLTVAIEHTTIDSFLNQRADTDRFMRVVGSLEKELKDSFRDRVALTIAVGSIPTGIDWGIIKNDLRAWLVKNVPMLPFRNQKRRIKGIPFPIWINKSKSNNPGLFVSRFAPENLQDQMAEVMRRALEAKNDQLGAYHSAGNHTILLIQSDDIALANVSILKSALKMALDSDAAVGSINEIWLADTSIDQYDFYLLSKR